MLSVSNFVRGPPITPSALSSVTSPSHQGQHRWALSFPPTPSFYFLVLTVAFSFMFLMIVHRSPNAAAGT